MKVQLPRHIRFNQARRDGIERRLRPVPLPQVIDILESSASTAAWILVVAIVVPVVVVFLIILAIVVVCVSAFCLSISCVSHHCCLNLSQRAVRYSKSCVSGILL